MTDRNDRSDRQGAGRQTEGVRIIGAEEAQKALDAGQASGRRSEEELRFGDVPPAPRGPRPEHRFPLPDSVDPAAAVPRPPIAPLPTEPRREARRSDATRGRQEPPGAAEAPDEAVDAPSAARNGADGEPPPAAGRRPRRRAAGPRLRGAPGTTPEPSGDDVTTAMPRQDPGGGVVPAQEAAAFGRAPAPADLPAAPADLTAAAADPTIAPADPTIAIAPLAEPTVALPDLADGPAPSAPVVPSAPTPGAPAVPSAPAVPIPGLEEPGSAPAGVWLEADPTGRVPAWREPPPTPWADSSQSGGVRGTAGPLPATGTPTVEPVGVDPVSADPYTAAAQPLGADPQPLGADPQPFGADPVDTGWGAGSPGGGLGAVEQAGEGAGARYDAGGARYAGSAPDAADPDAADLDAMTLPGTGPLGASPTGAVPASAAEAGGDPAWDGPAWRDQPVWRDEPAFRDQPASLDEPASRDQPALLDEPASRDQPAWRDEPAWTDQPASRDEPAWRDQPASHDQPAWRDVPSDDRSPGADVPPPTVRPPTEAAGDPSPWSDGPDRPPDLPPLPQPPEAGPPEPDPAQEGITVTGSTQLPHWTQPPAPDPDEDPWGAAGGARWRSEHDDWEEDPVGYLTGEHTALVPGEDGEEVPYSFDQAFERLEEERTGAHPAVPFDDLAAEPEVVAPEDPTVSVSTRPRRAAVADDQAGARPARGRHRSGSRPVPRMAPPRPAGRGRDVTSRLGIGIGLAVVLLGCYAVGPGALLALATVVIVACAAESYGILQRSSGFRPATLLGLVASGGLVLAAYWKGPGSEPIVIGLTFIATMLWFLGGVSDARPLANVMATVMTVLWVGVLGSFAGLLLAAPRGKGLFFGAVAVTVIADTVSYFFGRRFGNRPLAPRISPGKTVEGLVGGTVAAVVMGLVIGGLVAPWGGLAHGLELGLVVSVAAPIGDLFESMIKRDLDVKDSGHSLGGHGGMLDRFDSVLVVLPAAYFLALGLHLVG